MIIVDYLQLLRTDARTDNRVQAIGEISRGLKILARELEVPVIALSQLSRGVESRTDKRPMLSDLRESARSSRTPDLVMFIYRDEYYNENTDRPGEADLIVAKHRNGGLGDVPRPSRASTRASWACSAQRRPAGGVGGSGWVVPSPYTSQRNARNRDRRRQWAMKARARSSTSSPSTQMSSSAFRAATTQATRSSTRVRPGSST